MAATSTKKLFHLLALFVLLLTQLTDSAFLPKSKIKNHAELKPEATNTYIVHCNHHAKPPHFTDLEQWYQSMVASHSYPVHGADYTTSGRILYTYDTVMHGFAVRLTGDEAQRMSSFPGVTRVHEDRKFYLQTTRSPGFMGLDPHHGAWNETDFGDGVIIGLIDGGIWPESASFSDHGLGPVRSTWRGKCVDAADFNATLCNRKLVGARAFDVSQSASGMSYGTVSSPRDKDGHGTHVASTAAGAEVPDAGMFMFSRGTARGVAPKARIAMYNACGVQNCQTADIVAAVDAAVKDGVDIISMSLGGDPSADPYDTDAVSVALFGAERHGVFVSVAGGNSGPGASTVTNSAPWMTTVGAATVDRLFPADLTLGNGVVLAGQSLYAMKAKGTGMVQLVTVDCDVPSPDDLDLIFTPDKVMGKIVVCGTVAGVVHGVKLQKAGGAGLVSVDGSGWSGDGVPAFTFTLPAVTLSYADGEKLNAYMAAARNPVASFSFGCDTVTGENRAPVVADFSSRGPNPVVPELLKPDVVAPGVNILAAWSGDASLSGQEEFDDGRRVEFNIISGTSMATPHVAGVAALIRKKQPSWTPAMIRSAIMTTAGTLDTTGRDILDNGATPPTSGRRDGSDRVATPLAAGAGHVRPDLALDPGLVYDAGERDYVDFLCTLNYTAEQVRMFMPGFGNCTRTLPGGPAGLNYPSFMVVFGNGTDVRTLTRTVTAVSEKAETYTVSYAAPERVKVTVTPTTLEFTKPNQKKSYTVEFRSLAGGNVTAGWDFGRISWESMDHTVRSPVAFQWNNN